MRRKSTLFLAGVLSITLMMPANASIPSGDSNINSQVEAAGEAVDQANAEVTKALKAYNKVAVKLSAAKKVLKAAKVKLQAARGADQKAQLALSKSEAAMSRAYKKLDFTRSNLNAEKTEVSQLIRSVYRQGPMSELAIIMGADTPADFTARVAALATWNANKNATITKLTKAREDLTQLTTQLNTLVAQHTAKKQAAAARVAEAKAAAAAAQAAQDAVNKLVAQRQKALNTAMKHKAAVQRRYNALKAEQKRLQELANNAGSLNTGTFKGSMYRPVTAGITSYGGWRIHPIFKIRRCHAGIDFGARYGSPIRAAANGVVASTAYMNGYGKATLISHGSGVTTLYAHQSRQSVKKGQTVKKGQIIGYVGSTGWSTGPHLHFEVRVKGVAMNPLGWLGGGSKTPICK